MLVRVVLQRQAGGKGRKSLQALLGCLCARGILLGLYWAHAAEGALTQATGGRLVRGAIPASGHLPPRDHTHPSQPEPRRCARRCGPRTQCRPGMWLLLSRILNKTDAGSSRVLLRAGMVLNTLSP